MKVHVETPDAIPLDLVMTRAFSACGIEPLGGTSADGWSKVSDLQRCPYRYYLRHERALQIAPEMLTRESTGALEIGGLVHAALALHYNRMLPEGYPGWRKNPPAPLDFLEKVADLGGERNFVNEAARLVGGYIENYGYERDIHPVAIEFPAGQPGIHTCRFDMLAWWDGGGTAPAGLWNVESKTASRETADVLEGWWLDGEVIGQHYVFDKFKLAELFHAPLQGTIINLIIKTHPPRYRRLEIVMPREVIEAYAEDRGYWSTYRDHCRNVGHWPRKLQGCLSRYDMCEFWSHCRDMKSHYLVPIRRGP